MRVRIDIGLDFDGMHTFDWAESKAPGSIDVPRTTLQRWTKEREAFKVAYLRWRRTIEEIEDTLYKVEPETAEAHVQVGVAAWKSPKTRSA